MASRRSEKQSEIQLKVMRYISEIPEVSSRRIAKLLVYQRSAYYVLTALVEKGLVKLENFKKIQGKIVIPTFLTLKEYAKNLFDAQVYKTKRQEYRDLKMKSRLLRRSWPILAQTQHRS